MKKLIILFAVLLAYSFASLTPDPRETQIFGQLGQTNLIGVDYAFVEAKKGEVVEAVVEFPSVRLIFV